MALSFLLKKAAESADDAVFYSQGTADLGKEIMSVSLLNSLLEFQRVFREAGESAQLAITSFEVKNAGQVEAQMKEGWRVFLDTKESMEWQQTKLELLLQEKIPLKNRGELEYIDLRFGDQAYVKYLD